MALYIKELYMPPLSFRSHSEKSHTLSYIVLNFRAFLDGHKSVTSAAVSGAIIED